MREILFKANRTDNGEWVEGNLVWSEDADEEYRAVIIPKTKSNMFLSSDERDLGFESWYLVDPETICQYTGLTDKNGKKIWENDIVKVRHEKYPKTPDTEFDLFPAATVYTRNYSVEFINTGSNYGYRCRNRSIHFLITKNTVYNHDIEIIGNIFDNPELLGGDSIGTN